MKRKNPTLQCLLLVLIAFSFAPVFGQQTFKVTTKSVIGYLEYVPPGYNNNSNKYPIVIHLHGIGEKGPTSTDISVLDDGVSKLVKLGPPKFVQSGTDFPFILISPQLKSSYGMWTSSYVKEVIDHVKTYLRVDEKRIYLTGLSLGGGGAWYTAQDFPQLFAAIAPVCGGYNTPSKAGAIANEDLPVWAFHGDKDSVVPMSKSVNMVNAINAYSPSPRAKLTIYPGVAHNAWDYAYKPDHTVHNPNVYEWMLSYTNTKNGSNTLPTANAGADKTAGSSVTLSGSGSDNNGSISSYAWTQSSGPSKATLSNASTRTATASGLKTGTYIFRLRVTDNGGDSDSDYIKVTVGSGSGTSDDPVDPTPTTNAAPVANAGADKLITLPTSSTYLYGNGTDSDGTIASYLWTKVSGPYAILGNKTTKTLKAYGLTKGTYVFRLTVKDNDGATRSDDVTLTVNAPPVANAGANKTVYLPTSSTTIYGNGTDADGTIASYQWTKVSGPSTTLSGSNTKTLKASALKAGSYKFRLTVKDNKGASKSDDMYLTVKS